MKQYLSLFVLVTSGLLGSTSTSLVYPKPAIVTSTIKNVKSTLNTPAGNFMQRGLPYALLFVYYIRTTEARELLPIPGLSYLKQNIIGGTPCKEKRFTPETLNEQLTLNTAENTTETKTVKEWYDAWKKATKEKNGQKADTSVAKFVKEYTTKYNYLTFNTSDHILGDETFGNKLVKECKKLGVFAQLFKWSLIGYITANVGRDAKDMLDYVTTEE
ncbi:TPA: hypothetical protein DCW54_02850 [Candidatus Dependentiae bacterium]|nr:hypothetical protein [Candidatus Dependentiae bacterium]